MASADVSRYELARELFLDKQYDKCLLVLHAARQHGDAEPQDIKRLSLVCQVHKHAAAGDWWQVLALEPGHDEAAIKRQYRKLAQALHPDKSSTVGTEEAFKLVGQAVSRIMQSSCGVHSGWPEDGAAAAWWEEWEGCRRDPHLPSSEPSAEESADPLLAQLEIAALRAEVVRRQAAVFKPEAGSQEQNLSATERQKRLRGARTVLAERLKVLESYDHVIAQGLIDVEGGFL